MRGRVLPTRATRCVPFGEFGRLHFARLVLLEDSTLGDIAAYGLPLPNLPTYLAFMGDCDGPAGELLAEIARRAGPGLARIFGHCEGFDAARRSSRLDVGARSADRRKLCQQGRPHSRADQRGECLAARAHRRRCVATRSIPAPRRGSGETS